MLALWADALTEGELDASGCHMLAHIPADQGSEPVPLDVSNKRGNVALCRSDLPQVIHEAMVASRSMKFRLHMTGCEFWTIEQLPTVVSRKPDANDDADPAFRPLDGGHEHAFSGRQYDTLSRNLCVCVRSCQEREFSYLNA